MRLSVLDVSGFVHVGMNVDTFKNEKVYGFNVGGVRFLTRQLSLELSKGFDVVCAFDSRSFRKDLDSNYKKGRVSDVTIRAQLEFLYENLLKCGVACYKVDGLEADDIIYNTIEQNKANYKTVRIFGCDYDLCHNVDEEKVIFESITSQVNTIKPINFSTIKKGETIHFNTISAYKVLLGDNSDNISSFYSARGYTGRELYKGFVDFLTQDPNKVYPSVVTRDKRALLGYLGSLGDKLTASDLEELNRRIKLVYPQESDQPFIPRGRDGLQSYNYEEFCNAIKDNASIKCLSLGYSSLSDERKQEFIKLSKSLATGEFAVDRSMSFNKADLNTTSLFLKEF